MAKCTVCNERKGQRACPAVGAVICSLCCGTKRQKEIQCVETCQYLSAGTAFQLQREVDRAVIDNFQSEADDVYKIPEVVQFVIPIERAFVEEFAGDPRVTDEQIREAVGKLYLYLGGKTAEPEATNRVEEVTFAAFRGADAEYPQVSRELKAKAMARILRSIRSSSGGALGPRGYLGYVQAVFEGRM